VSASPAASAADRDLPAARAGAAARRGAEWKPLNYFNLYRATLAGLFLVLLTMEIAPGAVGAFDADLFRLTAVVYFVFSIAAGAGIWLRWPAFDVQLLIHVLFDIAAITLMMHASGGVVSGFGMLLVAAVAGGSLLAAGRIAILFAAVASLATLGQQIYSSFLLFYPGPNYPHAGMLGAAFFTTALLAFVSARRIRASEALAVKRGIDLANLAQLNEHIIQRMQSGILALDADNRVRLMNESARRMLGLAPADDAPRLEALAPELVGLLRSWRQDRSHPSYLHRTDRTGLEVTVSFAGLGTDDADGVLVFLEDASAIRQRAQHLKLASLGRLTASIAHEIRNPLAAISHAGQLLEEDSGLPVSDRRLTGMIRENSRRMNAIIENVLQLSRRSQAAPESFELRQWLESFVDEYARNTAADASELSVVVEPPDLRVRIDPSQLQQVVWNLCDNGLRHANGVRSVELRAGLHRDSRRPYLDVTDAGEGIPEELAEQIFEPFFTTEAGGTGLGLYIARELCEGNQASLRHVPTESGCRFRITFADPRRHAVPLS